MPNPKFLPICQEPIRGGIMIYAVNSRHYIGGETGARAEDSSAQKPGLTDGEGLISTQFSVLMSFEEYWRTLEQSGWLETYSTERREDLKTVLERCFNMGDRGSTVFHLGGPELDPKALVYDDFAISLLQQYEYISDGRFCPTDVVGEHTEPGMCRIGFTFSDRRFEKDIAYESEALEAETNVLCNEALEAVRSPYRFCETAGGLALVEPEAYEKIHALGWLTVCELADNHWGAALPGVELAPPRGVEDRLASASASLHTPEPETEPPARDEPGGNRALVAHWPTFLVILAAQLLLLWPLVDLAGWSPYVLVAWLALTVIFFAGTYLGWRNCLIVTMILTTPANLLLFLIWYQFSLKRGAKR